MLLILCACAFADKKPKGAPAEVHQDMLVEVPGLEIQKAQKPCDNWAWWAAVKAIFEQQNLPLPQSYFVDHSDGGACLNNDDHPLNLYDVASASSGDYALPDGRRFHSEVSLGQTAVPVPMIVAALRAGRPLLIVWNKRPYLIQGILFDDYVYPGPQHSFVAKELHLINPANGERVKLALDNQAVSEIAGTLDIVITELNR
jgi:hypothetical protein